MFAAVFKTHRLDLDADGEIGRQLALAWRAVLDEREQLGEGAYGAANKRWHELLRQL